MKFRFGIRGGIKPPLNRNRKNSFWYKCRYFWWKVNDRLYQKTGLPEEWSRSLIIARKISSNSITSTALMAAQNEINHAISRAESMRIRSCKDSVNQIDQTIVVIDIIAPLRRALTHLNNETKISKKDEFYVF